MIVGAGVVEATKNAVEGLRLSQRLADPGGLANEPALPLGVLITYLGSFADPRDLEDWSPNELLLEGMDQAFRDLWADVRSTAPTEDNERDVE